MGCFSEIDKYFAFSKGHFKFELCSSDHRRSLSRLKNQGVRKVSPGVFDKKKMHPERDLLALGHSGPLKILTAPKEGLLSIRLDLIYLD